MDKPFQVLKRIDPSLEKIGIVYNPSLFREQVNGLEITASQYGLQIIRGEIEMETDIPDAIKKITEQVDAVYLMPDPMTMTPSFIKKIMLTTFKKKNFVFGESYEWVKKGALAGFAFNINEVVQKTYEHLKNFTVSSDIDSLDDLKCEDHRLFLNARVAHSIGLKIDKKSISDAKKTGKVIE
jgi:putative ABC transport system substrate-binding protein